MHPGEAGFAEHEGAAVERKDPAEPAGAVPSASILARQFALTK